jgi:alpha-1,2-mannosyltransferase
MDGSTKLALSRPDWLGSLKAGDFLDRRCAVIFGTVLLVFEIAAFLFFVAGTHGWIIPLERPTTTDFVSFYGAGSLADAGTPALAYDQAAHYAAEQQATEPGIEYNFFYYPPVYLLICALFGRLPYMAAFVAFEALSLLLCLLVARRIVTARNWTASLPLLAFPSVFWTMGLGQNAFLTAALFGGALLLIDRRPVLAGMLFGLICYKPHFGVLIPVALIAGSRWRAVGGAALAVAAVVALSIAVFGWHTWHDFFTLAGGSPSTYENGRIDLSGLVTLFGGLRLIGVPTPLAYSVQGLGAIAAIALVAVVWRCNLSLPTRAAALAAATLIAVPVALVYDFLLAGIAMAWLIRAGSATGFLPWEKMTFAVVFIVPLMSRNFGTATHVPLAQLALIALLALIVRRAWYEGDKAERWPGLTSSGTA